MKKKIVYFYDASIPGTRRRLRQAEQAGQGG